MDWQRFVSLMIVAATAAIFVRSWMRPRKFDFKRDTHCGCATATAGHSVVFHARKGQRRQIITKMK